MKPNHRPGIEASRRVRSASALAHLETMRADYISIVRDRLGDPTIEDSKKLSIYAIAKKLADLGHRAPRYEHAKTPNQIAKVPYRVAKRLSELVGEVAPLPKPTVKPASALGVGDQVQVISPDRDFHLAKGEVREVLDSGKSFNIAIVVPINRRVLKFVYSSEIRHLSKSEQE